MRIKSKSQAAFLGARASGRSKGKNGPSPAKARLMLAENRGFKMRNLPARAPKRVSKRTNSRSGRR